MEKKRVTASTHRLFGVMATVHVLLLIACGWLFWGGWGEHEHGLLGDVRLSVPSVAKGAAIIVVTMVLGLRGLGYWVAVIRCARRTGIYVPFADDDESELLQEAGITPVNLATRSTMRLAIVLVVVVVLINFLG